MPNKLVKSLLTLLTISGSVAFLLSNDWIGFTKYFVFTTVVQTIIYNVYKDFIRERYEKVYNERLKEYSKQGCEITCPCDRACRHFIPIEINGDNSYACQDCDRKIAVDVQVKSFLSTDPVNLEREDEKFAEVYSRIISEIQQSQ
jgi:hypothetical protein